MLAAFLASFSAALASHAPGGLGVFELVFVAIMPDVPKAEVLAALIIFRIFYLLIPFAVAIMVVLLFERARVAQAWRDRTAAQGISPMPSPLHMPTTTPVTAVHPHHAPAVHPHAHGHAHAPAPTAAGTPPGVGQH